MPPAPPSAADAPDCPGLLVPINRLGRHRVRLPGTRPVRLRRRPAVVACADPRVLPIRPRSPVDPDPHRVHFSGGTGTAPRQQVVKLPCPTDDRDSHWLRFVRRPPGTTPSSEGRCPPRPLPAMALNLSADRRDFHWLRFA